MRASRAPLLRTSVFFLTTCLACAGGDTESPFGQTLQDTDVDPGNAPPADDAAAPPDAPAAEADAGPPACVPVNARYGLNVGLWGDVLGADPQQVAFVGARWARVEFIDACDASTPPQRFAAYDAIVSGLRAAGVRVLLLVDYQSVHGVPFGARDDAPWDAFSTVFAPCAAQIAAHFAAPPFAPDTIGAYEIWNEEDNPPGNPAYDPYVPPGAYGRMFKSTADAMRSAIRSVAGNQAPLPVVVTGGLDAGSYSGYLETALAALPGGIGADAAGVHSYGTRPDPDWPTPGWGFAYLGDDLSRYASIAQMPLWITEFGTEDLPNQAEFVRRFYARLAQDFDTVVPRAFYFAWSDSTAGKWGLVDIDGNTKDSYCAYRQSAFRLGACADQPAPGSTCP